MLCKSQMTTRYVCNTPSCCSSLPSPCYNSISLAVSNSSAGDTIIVAAGTYNECVTIPAGLSNLKLLGAQAGVDARTRMSTNESIVSNVCANGAIIVINANQVTIDGFTVQGNTASGNAGIFQSRGVSGAQLLNNIVQNNVIGIYLTSTTTTPFQTVVQRNLIQNNNQPGAASGNGIYSDQGLANALIDSNTFTGHTNTSILLQGLVPSFGNNPVQNITISTNLFQMDAGIVLINTTNVIIIRNTFNQTIFEAIALSGGNSLITIGSKTVASSGNCIISSANEGIRIDTVISSTPNSNVTINGNNITCNGPCPSGDCSAGNCPAVSSPILVGLNVVCGSYTPKTAGGTGCHLEFLGSRRFRLPRLPEQCRC